MFNTPTTRKASARRRRAALCLTTACAGALLWSEGALAQSTPQPSTAGNARVGEIIVTARKRQELILNVPVVETAIGAEQLERMQVRDLKDISRLVPGLIMGRAVLGIGGLMAIRGVGTVPFDVGVDQSVAFNVDGMSIATGLALQSSLFDVGQVEVLKGPQSLFYGKSSTGGVMSIRTADPTDKFETKLTLGYEAEAVNPRAEVVVSGPITDTLKIRLAGLYSYSRGYFHMVGQGQPGTGAANPPWNRGPRSENAQIRATALWTPTEKFDARLKVNLVEDHTYFNDIMQMKYCPEGVSAPPLGVPYFLGGGEDCKFNREVNTVSVQDGLYAHRPHGGVSLLFNDQAYGTLEMNYHLQPELTLSSTTGYYNVVSTGYDAGTNPTYAGTAFVGENHVHRHNFTQEVRLNSDYAGAFNFTAGGYFENGAFTNRVEAYGNPAYFGSELTFVKYTPHITNKTYSAFGQLRWKIMPRLELAVGARYTDEKRAETADNLILGTPTPLTIVDPEVRSKTTTPDVTLTWRPTDDLTWFAAFREAYKSGGYSTSTAPELTTYDNAFGEEKATGGEVGVKSRWLNRSLLVNAAGYYYHFRGLQVGAVKPAKAGQIVQSTVSNAGSARTYGVDFDFTYYPESIEGLSVNGSVNWNKAEYRDLDTVPCYGGQTIALGCNVIYSDAQNNGLGGFTAQDLSGTPLVRAPHWQMAGGFSYQMPFANGFKLTFTNTNTYSSEYVAILAANYPGKENYQKGFAKVDLGVTLASPDDRWEFAVIGKNVTDKITAGSCTGSNFAWGAVFGGQSVGTANSGPAGLDEIACFADPGREVWFRVTYRN